MGAISRGWALTKQNGAVLRNDQSLLVFPVLSTIFAIIALVAIWLPTAVLTGIFQTETPDESNPYYIVAAFFVVPVVALEGAGPWRSLKRSVEVVVAIISSALSEIFRVGSTSTR